MKLRGDAAELTGIIGLLKGSLDLPDLAKEVARVDLNSRATPSAGEVLVCFQPTNRLRHLVATVTRDVDEVVVQ